MTEWTVNNKLNAWYQKRYHIKLPKEFETKSEIYFGGSSFSPSALFALAEPGVWFDPSDLTTLFQDPAGTTPVTTPGQTVGLMLDKSQALALGAELVTPVANQDFSSDTGYWTKGSGVTISGGSANWTAATSYGLYRAGVAGVSAGNYYEVTFTVSNYVSGTIRVYLGSVPTLGPSITANGTYTTKLGVVGSGEIGFFAPSGSAFTGSIDDFSVKAIAGNHATQATLAARPTYSIEPVGGRRNLLLQTEAFDTASWSKSSVTASAGTITATASSGFHCVTQVATTSGSFVVASVRAKPGTSNFVWVTATPVFGLANYATAVADLATGQVTKTQSGGTLAGATAAISGPDAQGFYRVTLSAANPTSAMTEVIGIIDSATPTITSYGSVDFAASGTESIITGGAQLELGSTATAYQRVTTQHDVTEAGVASVGYLYFDGAGDFMFTSTITPGIDKAQVFSGVRKLGSGSNAGIIFETSAAAESNAGAFRFGRDSSGYEYFIGSGGTAYQQVLIDNSAFNSPVTNTLTGLFDISAPSVTVKANGAQVGQNTASQGTGNFLAYPLFIGARGNAGPPYTSPSLFYWGHLYSLITRFGPTLDAPTITSTEIWVGDKTGIDIAKITSTTIYTRSGDTILDRANSTIERRA